MARVTLRAQYKGFQPETTIEVADEIAESLIKSSQAVKGEAVYSHEDEMTPELRAVAHQALAAAEAVGGVNAVAARTAATEPFRNRKK